MTKYTTNKLIATKPFPKLNVEKVFKGGMALVEQKVQLAELEVVLPATFEGLRPGDFVSVRGDAMVQPWAKESFVSEGQEYILVPESYVLMVRRGTPTWVDGGGV